MLLPTPDMVLNPKFGEVIPKTVTSSLWTEGQTDRQTNEIACIHREKSYCEKLTRSHLRCEKGANLLPKSLRDLNRFAI